MSDEFQFPNDIDGYIGPALMMVLLQSVETGVIIGQAITFWSYTSTPMTSALHAYRDNGPGSGRGTAATKLPRDRKLMKVVAGYVLVLTILQTTFSFYDVWIALVVNWGKLPESIEIHWLTKLQPVLNTILSEPVQGFLIWRCWLLTNRNNYLLICLILLMAASAAMSIVFTVGAFSLSPSFAPSGVVFDFSAVFTASLAIPTLLDALLTGILFTYLIRSRNVVVSRRFRKMLHVLIAIIWEAAFPPCLCAVITIAIYFRSAKTSSWFLLFQAVLGQLYVISFFVTINGFLSVKNKDSGLSPTTALGQSWGTAAPRFHSQGQNRECALTFSGRDNRHGGVHVAVNVQTTHDSPTSRRTIPRSFSSRLQRIPKSSQRFASHSAHVLDIPVGIRLPSPDAKVSDEANSDVKGTRDTNECESGRDRK